MGNSNEVAVTYADISSIYHEAKMKRIINTPKTDK